MILKQLPVAGAFLIEPEPLADERGFFARTYCVEELGQHGLETAIAQGSLSFNHHRGTVRGLHFQAAPHEETKLVRCTRGAIFDVLVDLRPDSPTFLSHAALTLSAENRTQVYIPRGVAHGFQTLEEGTEVFYQISTPHAPESARGFRFDDPAFGITWPLPVAMISDRDLSWPRFGEAT